MSARSTAVAAVDVPATARPVASDSHALMRMIETLVQKPEFDPAKLDQLLAVKERWDATEARKAFVAAMAAFKAEPMEIVKRKLVSFTTRDGDTTSYKHAELADVTAVVCPALAKHGLSHAWNVQQANAQISVTCTITHELGHSESVTLSGPPDQSGKKNAIQQVASTVTYLQRYTLLAICGLATTGMDDDGRAGGEADAEQDKEAERLLASWSAAIEECTDVDQLKKRKVEMGAAYGGTVPTALVDAYNAKLKALKNQ